MSKNSYLKYIITNENQRGGIKMRKERGRKKRKEKKNKNRWKGKGAYLAVRAEKNVVISERKFSLSTKIT